MDITTDLIFKGKQLVSWISEDEKTGLIDIVFNADGFESVFSFEPRCFDAMARAINEFLNTGKTTIDTEYKNGKIKPGHIFVDFDRDKHVSIEADLGEVKEENPSLNISSGKGSVNLNFNYSQAKALIETLQKIIQIKELSEDVESEKTVKSV